MLIKSGNKNHDDACASAESARQKCGARRRRFAGHGEDCGDRLLS
jgi:hypothetical protein